MGKSMKNIAFIFSNNRFKKQIKYAIDVIFENYDVNYSVLSIEDYMKSKIQYDFKIAYTKYNNLEQVDLIILEADLFGEDYLKKESLPKEVSYHNGLPVFFTDNKLNFYNRDIYDKPILNIDIIQTVFYFLTCYEDYVINEYDNYHRSNIRKSILFNNNLFTRPVVNEYISFFYELLNSEFQFKIKKRDIWEGRDFAVLLSHDVDIINKYLPFKKEMRLQISIILKEKKIKKFLQRVNGYLKTVVFKLENDEYNNFDYLLNIEKENNYKASYYFMSTNECYNIESSNVAEIIKKIKQNGSEIGFHPGFNTCVNEENFKAQFDKIKEIIGKDKKIGIRHHYLGFDARETWHIHNNNNILYDTTIAHPECAGFKVGYCLPYKPYILSQDKVADLWEIPLIVMDGMLLQYMNLNYEEAVKYSKELIENVQKYNGVFTLLWHNSSINRNYSIYSEKLFKWYYTEFLKHNCIVTTGKSIINNYMEGLKQ